MLRQYFGSQLWCVSQSVVRCVANNGQKYSTEYVIHLCVIYTKTNKLEECGETVKFCGCLETLMTLLCLENFPYY